MQCVQLYDDNFLRILWDEERQIISLDWKERTAEMTDEEFRAELTSFADYVEKKRAPGILVDVTRFHHQMGADLQEWRLKNISTRYNAAGVQRFAFIFPNHVEISPMASRLSEVERFVTGSFHSHEAAVAWLIAVK